MKKVNTKNNIKIEAGKQYYIVQFSHERNCAYVDVGTLCHIIPIVGSQDKFSKNTERASYYHFSVFYSKSLQKTMVIYNSASIFQTIEDVKNYCLSNDIIPYYGYSVCKI